MTADQVARLLDELGRRLGPAGARVFDLAVRQVVIDSAILLLWAVLAAALAGLVWRRAAGMASFDRGPARVGAIVLVGLAVLLTGYAMSRVLNPEYAAIQSLLEGLR